MAKHQQLVCLCQKFQLKFAYLSLSITNLCMSYQLCVYTSIIKLDLFTPQAVESMSIEQQRRLLFFWTSVKYLPSDGFGGLGSKLYIYKQLESADHLPSSHTCFYRLCLPPYPSLKVMQSQLQKITQEHVSCSFGTW
jgi:hypothetical protein